jgi:hypothetical protein
MNSESIPPKRSLDEMIPDMRRGGEREGVKIGLSREESKG